MFKFRLTHFLALSVVLSLASCGDEHAHEDQASQPETQQTERTCRGIVRQYKNADGRVMKNELRCEGGCAKGECNITVMQDAKGNRRSWCACFETEKLDCHLVLYQPVTGTEMVFCSSEKGCGIQRVLVSEGPEGIIEDVFCMP